MSKKAKNTSQLPNKVELSSQLSLHITYDAINYFGATGLNEDAVKNVCGFLRHVIESVVYEFCTANKLCSLEELQDSHRFFLYHLIMTQFCSHIRIDENHFVEVLIKQSATKITGFDVVLHIFPLEFDLQTCGYSFLLPFTMVNRVH